MKKLLALSAVASTLCLALPAAHAVTFTPFVTSSELSTGLSNSATIGFAYAGNKFVGSVYYGANNNQLYSVNLNGGNLQTFGAPIPGFSGEIYVESSLGLGGFGNRDVYAGSESGGTIYRLSNDGSTESQFTTGLVGGVRSISFDPYGLYGNNMIVATNAGNIYEVSNTGAATLLANVGEDAEGLSFAPQAFGPYAAGTLFVASEGSGSLRAISPTGTKNTVITGLGGAEMVSFVPLNLGSSGNPVEGFYSANYPVDVIKAPASDFTPYIGDAIITSETGHGVYSIAFNKSTGGFDQTQIGTFPNQPEDGIFVTADIIKPPVPEPASGALMVVGVAGLGWWTRRRAQQAA